MADYDRMFMALADADVMRVRDLKQQQGGRIEALPTSLICCTRQPMAYIMLKDILRRMEILHI